MRIVRRTNVFLRIFHPHCQMIILRSLIDLFFIQLPRNGMALQPFMSIGDHEQREDQVEVGGQFPVDFELEQRTVSGATARRFRMLI